ncbi:formate dehydrogenase subunit delta [Roseicella sp. DB1501]|uniref:formate dehydrogenase subunit delta n=1 Tax=Roseicella sp. DB1501 TaxID=2730925 RepID=UPI001492A748|nr:formate dehydrogenase subunit delta [Roseicella sp. DB1501]NOG70634.1 formate dehydrogenase subunit delta [Roseicella sp. DB1501]
MSAKPEKLIRMANQIAAFFRAYPEAEAVAGTREHIQAFWTPGMRRALAGFCAAGMPGIDAVVVAAMREGDLAGSPIHREVAGPETLGPMESDAG